MAPFSKQPLRYDPYKNFKFRVKFGTSANYVAGVHKISALKRTTEVVEHREGGDGKARENGLRRRPSARSRRCSRIHRRAPHSAAPRDRPRLKIRMFRAVPHPVRAACAAPRRCGVKPT